MADTFTCNRCARWCFSYADGPLQFGTCSSLLACTRLRVAYQAPDEVEDSAVFTEADFGCRFCQAAPLVVAVVEIKKRVL